MVSNVPATFVVLHDNREDAVSGDLVHVFEYTSSAKKCQTLFEGTVLGLQPATEFGFDFEFDVSAFVGMDCKFKSISDASVAGAGIIYCYGKVLLGGHGSLSYRHEWLQLCSYDLKLMENPSNESTDIADDQNANDFAHRDPLPGSETRVEVQRCSSPARLTPETRNRRRGKKRKRARKHDIQVFSFQPRSDASAIRLGGRMRKVHADLQEAGIRITARHQNSSSNCWAVALCNGFKLLGCELRLALVESMVPENACKAMVELFVLQQFKIQRLQQLKQQDVRKMPRCPGSWANFSLL